VAVLTDSTVETRTQTHPDLARVARTVVEQAAARWEHRRPDDDAALDSLLWLRAARGAWLLGELETAQTWYVRAADDLLDLALGQGSATGTYAYYAEPALGAAALCGRAALLERVGEVVRTYPAPAPSHRQRSGRFSRAAEPAMAAHGVLVAFAAWLTSDLRAATLAVMAARRQASALPPAAQERWRGSHWPDALVALELLVDGKGEALGPGLRQLDRKLTANTSALHTVLPALAVNETLAALCAEWKKASPRTYDPRGFTLPVEAGLLAEALSRAGPQAEPPTARDRPLPHGWDGEPVASGREESSAGTAVGEQG
jgi:hypothetical protein